MFEKFLSVNAGDFRQRYEGTFGFYRDESGKRLLVKLVAIDHICRFVDAGGVEFSLNADTERNIGFEFLPPKSGWYNTPEGVLFTQRIAQRQFQRGATGKNLTIFGLNGGILTPRRVDFTTLSAIYEKAKTPQQAAKKGMDPIAISSQFCLAGGHVLLLSEYIGKYKVEDRKYTMTLDEPDLWRTEITDALKALDYSAEIR